MIDKEIMEKMERQNKEFDAVQRLTQEYRRIQLTPVVDEDYPAVRHGYEGAVYSLIKAFKENGRIS